MRKKLIILLLALLTININCSGGGSLSTDTSARTALTIKLGEVRNGSPADTGIVSSSSIPPYVTALRITISAPDMLTIQETISTSGLTSVSVTIEVPNGTNRHIVCEAVNDTGGVLYRGETYVDLDGTPVSVPIVMVSADSIPPTFAGLSSITSITQTSMVLSWSPATDNVTPQNRIQYLIYMALASEELDFSSPSFTTPLGATSYTVTGLSPNTAYKCIVWAMDEVGNRDGNMSLMEATTLAPPDTNPPTFEGLESATALSTTEVWLQWSNATDDVTPSSNIVYLIYMAMVSGGQDFNTPTYTTSPGVETYTVTGLSPETMYCFVVRAKDEAGNAETNAVEHCVTTTSIPPALSVSPSTATIIALPNPDPEGSDNVTFTVEGNSPPFNVTSSNTSVIPDPGIVSDSGDTFTVDPDQDCNTTSVVLNITDSDSGSVSATVNLSLPPFSDSITPDTICENDNTCTAATETSVLTLTGIPPFNVTSDNSAVIPNPGTSWTNSYLIDAVDGSLTANASIDLTSDDYCSPGSITTVDVVNQPDIELLPVNDGLDTDGFLIYCEVANNGPLNAFNVEVWFEYTDGYATYCDYVSVSVPGSGKQYASIGYITFPTDYRIIVDPNNNFAESDETNNCIDTDNSWCSLSLPTSCP